MNNTSERTLAEAVMNVRYGIAFAELNEKLWSHVDTVLSVFQVIAGMLALAGSLAEIPHLTGLTGAAVAILAGVQIAVRPRERSIDFRDARGELEDLNARAWGMTLSTVDAELAALRRRTRRGSDVFAKPAMNRALASNGYVDQTVKLSAWERWLSRLAGA